MRSEETIVRGIGVALFAVSALALPSGTLGQPGGTKTGALPAGHGLSMYGELKYGPGFKHFE